MIEQRENEPESGEFHELILRAQRQDSKAINALFEQFYPVVKSMVHKRLASDLRRSRPWLAARFSTGDVVQEVFRTVLADFASFAGKTPKAFAGYLVIVVQNRIVDAIRFHEAQKRDKRRDFTPKTGAGFTDGQAEPPEIAIAQEERRRFHAAMATLPERERLLVRARCEGTASFEELTEQLGFPSKTTTRRAFAAAQAKLVVFMQSPQNESDDA